jgi:hypothetical protein
MDNKTKIICTSKQVQIYEILNKIQNVINTESLLPRKFDLFPFRFFFPNLKQETLVKKNSKFILIILIILEFIYFAKTMEEMRKKWLQSELKCKELENKLSMEKSMFQRKINELK